MFDERLIEWPAGVHMIAAVGNQGQIGLDGKLPWHDSSDLKFFKRITMGCDLIVGPRTYETLPDMPGRNVILDDHVIPPPVFIVAHRIQPDECVWVIGGERTYRRWMPHVRSVVLTRINYSGPADTFMPSLWELDPPEVEDWSDAERGRFYVADEAKKPGYPEDESER